MSSRDYVSVYGNGSVQHYALDREGRVLRGVPGGIQWRDNWPSEGWELVTHAPTALAIRSLLVLR